VARRVGRQRAISRAVDREDSARRNPYEGLYEAGIAAHEIAVGRSRRGPTTGRAASALHRLRQHGIRATQASARTPLRASSVAMPTSNRCRSDARNPRTWLSYSCVACHNGTTMPPEVRGTVAPDQYDSRLPRCALSKCHHERHDPCLSRKASRTSSLPVESCGSRS